MITDKELLTFCNLANLQMEYANLKKIEENFDELGNKISGSTEERNHTIYSLLSQGRNESNIGDLDIDFDGFDENKDDAYIKNLPKIFRSKIEERKRRIEQRYGEEATKKVDIGLKKTKNYRKEGRKIIESAPIVFDYLDNPKLNGFLKEWEIVYAENLKEIMIDFMYYAYRDISEDILSREEFFLKYKFFEIEEDIEQKKEIEINFNKTTQNALENFIDECEYILLKETMMFIEENKHHIVKADETSLDPIMMILSIAGTGNTGNDLESGTFSKVKLFFNELELKGYKSLKKALKIKNIKIRDTMLQTLKKIDDLKIKNINCKKLSKSLEGVVKKCFSQKSLKTIGNIGNMATYLSMIITAFQELNSLIDKIENMYFAPKISFDRIKIRKSDFKVVILKKDKEYVIVFNNFEDSELKKCLDTGSMNRDFTYIMLSIIRKLLEDPNIKDDKEKNKAIISDQMEATKKGLELIEMKLDVPITFTGFGNGGALAAYFSGIFKKNFKSFENSIECQSSLINICNYNERDLDMIDENLKTSEILFSDITIVIYQAIWESTFSKACTGLMTFWCATSIISAIAGGATATGIMTIFISTFALYTFLGTIVVIFFICLDYFIEKKLLENKIEDFKKKNYLIEKNGILLVSDRFFETNPNRICGISISNRKLEFILEYLKNKGRILENMRGINFNITLQSKNIKDFGRKRYTTNKPNKVGGNIFFNIGVTLDIFLTKERKIDYTLLSFTKIITFYEVIGNYTALIETQNEKININNINIKNDEELLNFLIKTEDKKILEAMSIYNSLEFQYKIQNNLINRENFNFKNNNKLFYISPVNELIVFDNLNPIIENFNKFKNTSIYIEAYDEFNHRIDERSGVIYQLRENYLLDTYQIIEEEDSVIMRNLYNHQVVNLKDREELQKLNEKLDEIQQIKDYSSENIKKIDNIENKLKKLLMRNRGILNLRIFQDEYRFFPFIDRDNLTKSLNPNYTISGVASKIEELHKDVIKKAREARKKYIKEKIEEIKEYGNEVKEWADEKYEEGEKFIKEKIEEIKGYRNEVKEWADEKYEEGEKFIKEKIEEIKRYRNEVKEWADKKYEEGEKCVKEKIEEVKEYKKEIKKSINKKLEEFEKENSESEKSNLKDKDIDRNMKRLYEIIKFPTEKNLEKNEKLKTQISTWMKRSGISIPFLDEGKFASIFEGEFEKYFSVKESRNETEKTGTLLFNDKDENQPSFRFHRATRFHNKKVELKIPLIEDPNDVVEDKTEVLDGAVLRCSLGADPSNLEVTTHNKVYVKNRLVATVEDCKGGENIKSFGECKRSTPCPCIPKIEGIWKKGSEKVYIKDKAVLLSNAKCICKDGGEIRIEEPLGKVEIKK